MVTTFTPTPGCQLTVYAPTVTDVPGLTLSTVAESITNGPLASRGREDDSASTCPDDRE